MSLKVLYVEDNMMNMRLVRKMLTNTDYKLIEAWDGRAGVETAIREKPDVILMDVNLPGISGYEATQILKQHKDTGHIPIIALTSNDRMSDRTASIEAGCDGYVAKPISRAELVRTLNLFAQARVG